MDSRPLIEALIERQAGESDRRFAARLSLSHTHWLALKRGRAPGRKALEHIIDAYPELQIAAAATLVGRNASIATIAASKVSEEQP